MVENNIKDFSLLKDVSVYFTEETLRDIVAKDKNININKIEILSWDFGEASAKGDSYLSVVNRVVVKSRVDENEIVETKLIIKSLPGNIGRRNTYRSVEFFNNEIVFYTKIIPAFEEYLESKGKRHLLSIPRCLASLLDGENDYIVLEDVSVKGYGPICRQNCLSYEQCKCVVETLANFHAISFGFKKEKKEEFEKMADLLTETFYREDIYENWYKRFHNTVLLRIAKDALAKEYPGSEGEKVFNSYGPGELVKKCIEICTKRKHEPTSVINQGDAWAPNFLARQTDSGAMEALMLDFQLARCASPVLDVVFFIYACTDQPMRDIYYNKILGDYYSKLVESMKSLGVDAETTYSMENFKKEVKEQSVYGLTFALEAVPFTMMPADQAFDLDVIKDEKVDIADVWTLPNIQSQENRKRHADMILNAVQNGFI